MPILSLFSRLEDYAQFQFSGIVKSTVNSAVSARSSVLVTLPRQIKDRQRVTELLVPERIGWLWVRVPDSMHRGPGSLLLHPVSPFNSSRSARSPVLSVDVALATENGTVELFFFSSRTEVVVGDRPYWCWMSWKCTSAPLDGMTGHLPPGPRGAWSAGRVGRLNEVLRHCGRFLKRREGGAKEFTGVQPWPYGGKAA